jgi:ABC-type sugar transport system ATPase subunit
VAEPLLSIRKITKRFGGLVAVNEVSCDIYPGEVVGLLGDNGAGKSTLIKCISGVYQADEGEIYFEGRRSHFTRPIDARRQGIETIYQDLALANNLDVGANIFLGREVKKRYLGGLIRMLDEPHMLRESRAALEALEIHFPNLQLPIESLSGGQRQAVAIARAVYWDAKLMIMDEPTNNLGVPEQHKVLELIRKLRDRGVPVISDHSHAARIFAVSDRLIVMHRGRKVTEKRTAETDTQELVQYMVGALDDSRVQ